MNDNRTYAIVGMAIIIAALWLFRKGGVSVVNNQGGTVTVGGPVVASYNVAPYETVPLDKYAGELGNLILGDIYGSPINIDLGSFPPYQGYDANGNPITLNLVPYRTHSYNYDTFDWQTTNLGCGCEMYGFPSIAIASMDTRPSIAGHYEFVPQ